MKRPNLTRISLAVGLANIALSGAVSADNLVLEEIVVTAQKREQSIQDVPISVSAVSGEKIADAGINNLEGLSAYVPNLNISEGGQTTNIFMRGLGSGVNFGFEQSVGMYIDGVYYGRERQYRSPFLDLARVEVLRGPQGTLFGKNTIAGAINITTAKPTFELEGNVSVEYEPEYDTKSIIGVVSGPLTDTLAARLAVKDMSSDGFLENTLRDEDVPALDESIARLTLAWTPTEDLEVTTKFEHAEYDTQGRNLQIFASGRNLAGQLALPTYLAADPNFDTELNDTTSIQEEFSETDSDNAVVTVNYALGDYTLTSVTGYSAYEFIDQQDVDFSPLPALIQPIDQEFDQFSQELRLTSPLSDTFDYIVGLYYQTNDLKHSRRTDADLVPLGVPAIEVAPGVFVPTPKVARLFQFDQESDSIAVFAQGTWHISPEWHLTGGIRYTREEKTADQAVGFTQPGTNDPITDATQLALAAGIWNSVAGSVAHNLQDVKRDETDISPMLNLQWDVSQDLMLYASVSRGFKGGGFNEADEVGNHPDNPSFDPLEANTFEYEEETATAFELGGKATLLEGAAQLNFALFRTNYDNLQVSSFSRTTFTVSNAAEAITQGLELDGMWRVSDSITLNASMAWLDTEFETFEDASCNAVDDAIARAQGESCTQDISGEDLTFSPEITANIGLDYRAPLSASLELFSRLDVNYSDGYQVQNDQDPLDRVESHALVNASIGLAGIDSGWSVSLIGKNLTDEDYLTYSFDAPAQTGTHAGLITPPRTIAIKASYSY